MFVKQCEVGSLPTAVLGFGFRVGGYLERISWLGLRVLETHARFMWPSQATRRLPVQGLCET